MSSFFFHLFVEIRQRFVDYLFSRWRKDSYIEVALKAAQKSLLIIMSFTYILTSILPLS